MASLWKRRAGKHDAFEKEALVHSDALYRYAMHLSHDSRDAEDLVQDTLLKAFRFFERYEPGTQCKAWLFRIMTNTFLNSRRNKVKQFPFLENLDSADEDGALTDGWPHSEFYADPERQLMSRAFHDAVNAALEELPEDFRTVVLLADMEGFAYKEIADIMECPVGTVMSRLHRARKALRKRLSQFVFQEGYVRAPNEAAESRSAAASGSAPASLDAYRARRPNHSSGD